MHHRRNGHARYVLPLHRLPCSSTNLGCPGVWVGFDILRRLLRVLFTLCRRSERNSLPPAPTSDVLVIGADCDVLSHRLHRSRHLRNVFGDGAGAVILEPLKTIPLVSSISSTKSMDRRLLSYMPAAAA